MKLFRLLMLAVFFTSTVNAQLAGFNLSVSHINETCPGNGSLTFSVSGLAPGSTLLYSVYLLPDTEDPIAVITENTLGNLTAGTYRVIATQSLNGQTSSEQADVTIDDAILPFIFSVSAQNQGCSSGATIVLTATSGTITQAEITNGPVTRPLQTSTTFEDLPAGMYTIRAFDACGIGKVKTFNLTLVDNTPTVSPPFFVDPSLTSCTTALVGNTVTVNSGSIVYPLTVVYIIHVTGEPDTTITQTYATGATDTIDISANIPVGADITYDITITDGCGDESISLNNIIDPTMTASLVPIYAPCAERFLRLSVSQFSGSYTLNFLSAPADFVPSEFNPTPTGPFNTGTVAFGSIDNTVPFGEYEIEITDECGRTVTVTRNVVFVPLEPAVSGRNNGCFAVIGRIRALIENQLLVSATILDAPEEYEFFDDLPHDVTANINASGVLNLLDVPVGEYTISFTDDCGFTYEHDIVVPEFVQRDFEAATMPGCGEGMGGVTILSGNGNLTSVVITSGPLAGQDVSQYIEADSGDLYLGEIPAGDYVFTATDICGIVEEIAITVEGYVMAPNPFVYTPGCGVFTLEVTDEGSGGLNATYWLQRYNEETGTWGRPSNNAPYPEGTVPTTANSLKMNNNVPRYNLAYTGDFRIVKVHEAYTSGSAVNTICIDENYGEFEYDDELSIEFGYSLDCAGQPNDILLEITGQPTSIMITEMNGEPFIVDNGTNPLFTDLEPAEYTFVVEDDCGNTVPRTFDIQSLPQLTVANDPGDILMCLEPGAGIQEFNLAEQTPEILGDQPVTLYTVTYHATQADADSGSNPLPDLYQSDGNGDTIYARIVHNEIDLCQDTVSFQLFVGENPQPQITTTGILCDEALTLTAEAGFTNYVWSTGATGPVISVTEPGTYTVTVDRAYGSEVCTGSSETVVDPSGPPTITDIVISDWTENDNTISIIVTGIGVYEYSLDGEVYQDSGVFTGLEAGVYLVYVRDANGCGEVTQEVVLMHYPRFFTPNGDGTNDTWRIEYSTKEPHLNVEIYDRFGRKIISFGPNYPGWDGTFNGQKLPSTDYWFVVTREDGRKYKGHFAMVR